MLMYYARAAEPAEGGSSSHRARPAQRRAVYRRDGHDLADLRANGRATARIASPRRRCPRRRATCPSTWRPRSRSSSSGRCSCSISARATTRRSSRAAMASRGRRTIPAAVRELCLAFPEVEEFESHGSPNYPRAQGQGVRRLGAQSSRRRPRGPVAEHARARAVAAAGLVAAPVQAAVRGPVRLDRRRAQPGYFLEAGLRAGAHGVREQLAGETRREGAGAARGGGADREDEAGGDRSPAGAARAEGARGHAPDLCRAARGRGGRDDGIGGLARAQAIVSACCTTTARDSPRSSGWASSARVRSKWIRVSRSPRYLGHKGWMTLDLLKGSRSHASCARSSLESYRHFASRRAVALLDAQQRVA